MFYLGHFQSWRGGGGHDTPAIIVVINMAILLSSLLILLSMQTEVKISKAATVLPNIGNADEEDGRIEAHFGAS